MTSPNDTQSDDSIWEQPDGTWTVARQVVRSLDYYRALTPAEFYFVLNSLDAERFRWQWDNSNFFEQAGVLDEAGKAASLVTIGDYAWRKGDLKEAQLRYEQCVALGGSRALDGVSRLVRLYFVTGEYHKCVAMFRKDRGFLGMGSANCRAVIAAALRTGMFDYELRRIIADHFHVDEGEIDAMAAALGSDDQLPRIRKWLSPKPAPPERSLDDLMNDGNTERARTLVARIPRTAELINIAAAVLDRFLDTGDSAYLDEMVIAASPFGVRDADQLILWEVIKSRRRAIDSAPQRRLVLLRQLGYPTFRFLDEIVEVLRDVDTDIGPDDVISSMLNAPWERIPYWMDSLTWKKGNPEFSKGDILKNREWFEIILPEHPAIFDRAHWNDRETALKALYHAYLFLRDRFDVIRSDPHSIREAQLGDALAALFGAKEVERHARPTWLSPQHLDFFLPRYSLAVEYMGPQHYRPIEFFGGEQGLTATQARDERKWALCERMGINLVYVTHEEDVGRRAREIYEQHCGRSSED